MFYYVIENCNKKKQSSITYIKQEKNRKKEETQTKTKVMKKKDYDQ